MNKKTYLAAFLVCFSVGYPVLSQAGILFSESFDDTNLASRGWYDFSTVQLSTAEHVSGSTSSIEYRFDQGATTPASGKILRKKFSETDSVYISYYVKYSSNWEGSNRPYQPHEFYLLTNLENEYAGPSYTHLTAYVEQNEGRPLLSIQDGKNVDESRIGIDLKNVTEARAVAGCNGDSDGYGAGECYQNGSVHWNGKKWMDAQIYFKDTAGPYYKSDWHFIEAYFKLNSVQNGKGIADGQIKYWYDGALIINHENVMLRTGMYPDMKFNQLMIGPYIGDGSPVSQTFWVDNLTLSTARSTPAATDTTPPTILSTSPTPNATGIPTNTAVAATFSENLDASTITTATFTLKDATNASVAGVVTYAGTTATFTPSAPLADNTVYTATLTTGVKDAAGNALAQIYTMSFTTAARGSGSGGGSIDLTNASSGGSCSVAGRTGSGGSKVNAFLILAGLGMVVWRGRMQRKRN